MLVSSMLKGVSDRVSLFDNYLIAIILGKKSLKLCALYHQPESPNLFHSK